jgi:glutamate formiminotransferase/formiminotetrahydrofolate cyclodeaminase
MRLRSFIQEVSARSSAPGGGSVSAVLAALGTGLGAMAAKLTFGVRKYEQLDATMRELIPPLHRLTQELIPMIDADTNAFQEYMDGLRMPKDTDAAKAARTEKMQAGLKTAIRVPLKTMQLGDQAWDSLCGVAHHGNITTKSDMQVGARALETGIWGAYQNVLINMTGIRDEAFKTEILGEAEGIAARAREKCEEVLDILQNR